MPQSLDRLPYRRRRWAQRIIARAATPPPSYGSADWDALPEGDVRRAAAAVVAAECWAQMEERLVEDLQLELRLAAEAHKRLDDAEYVARKEAHAAEWSWLSRTRPRYTDQQPPRPLEDIGHDHMGEAS